MDRVNHKDIQYICKYRRWKAQNPNGNRSEYGKMLESRYQYSDTVIYDNRLTDEEMIYRLAAASWSPNCMTTMTLGQNLSTRAKILLHSKRFYRKLFFFKKNTKNKFLPTPSTGPYR
jgi:hypothetical protein